MKKISSIFVSVPLLILLSACSSNNVSSEYDDSSRNSNDIFLVSIIPQNFYYCDKNFVYNKDVLLNEKNITSFWGYFVNDEDLEKWQEYDQSCDFHYIVDENNSIYNYDLTGKLTNRFELFLTDRENVIALKNNGNYSAYISSDNQE